MGVPVTSHSVLDSSIPRKQGLFIIINNVQNQQKHIKNVVHTEKHFCKWLPIVRTLTFSDVLNSLPNPSRSISVNVPEKSKTYNGLYMIPLQGKPIKDTSF